MTIKVTMDSTVEEIADEYNNAYNLSTKPDPEEYPRFREDHVFDENMSVKWNRDEVAARNRLYESKKESLVNDRSYALRTLRDLLIQKLADETGLLESEVIVIYDRAYYEEHSSGIRCVVDQFFDLVDMYKRAIKARESAANS